MGNKSGEIQTKTYSSVFVRGLQIPSRFSPCKTHSKEMAQTSGFDPTTQVKTCFDCKMFDVANWVACLNGENGPGGTPSHDALSVSPQGALQISSDVGHPPSLDNKTISAHLEWWQNPTNVTKGAELHPKDHSENNSKIQNGHHFWQVKYSLKLSIHRYPVDKKFCRNHSILHGF